MLPSWSFTDVATEVSNLLATDAISGLVISLVALGLAGKLIEFVRGIAGKS